MLCIIWVCSYHPVPVVFAKAKDVSVWDPEGKEYLDFLSAYSAVNQVLCCLTHLFILLLIAWSFGVLSDRFAI